MGTSITSGVGDSGFSDPEPLELESTGSLSLDSPNSAESGSSEVVAARAQLSQTIMKFVAGQMAPLKTSIKKLERRARIAEYKNEKVRLEGLIRSSTGVVQANYQAQLAALIAKAQSEGINL